MPCQISAGCVQRSSWSDVEGHLPWDIESVWDWVHWNWNRQRSCSFFDPEHSNDESKQDNPGCQEHHRQRDFQASPRGKRTALGWGVLDQRILCQYGWASWRWKYYTGLCSVTGQAWWIWKNTLTTASAVLIPRQLCCEVVHYLLGLIEKSEIQIKKNIRYLVYTHKEFNTEFGESINGEETLWLWKKEKLPK